MLIHTCIHIHKNIQVGELHELTSSQCAGSMSCYIQFNTSSLELTGVINGTGTIKTTSQGRNPCTYMHTYIFYLEVYVSMYVCMHVITGTEVALFSFNSIYLGPETKVILVGQRALVRESYLLFLFG